MNIIIASVLVLTGVQLWLCKFSLWWLISLICRILFCCRIVGATVKVRKLLTGEIVAFATMFLFNLLFASTFPWGRIIIYLLLSLLCVGLEFLDDLLYVYTIEDEEGFSE